jgi:hypothetical protein
MERNMVIGNGISMMVELYHPNGQLDCKKYYDMGKEVDYVVNLESEVTPEMFSIF